MLQRQEVAGVAARARRSRARASAREAGRGPAVILQRESEKLVRDSQTSILKSGGDNLFKCLFII